MADSGIGDYFISDVEDVGDEDDELLIAPVVVAAAVPVVPVRQAAAPVVAPAPTAPRQAPQPPIQVAQPASAHSQAARPQASTRPVSREEQLVAALDNLMEHSPDIQAAALVSLDGFTMASALPADMQEDRVGAMSAAILGLGERAAAELGRGHLSQVFIEGEHGYVLLMAAGDRAVLTSLADPGAKLGLVLYDMREAANSIGEILR